MEVKVRTGQSEVVNSGIAFVLYGEKLEFLIENLKFYLTFDTNDETAPGVKYHIEKIENESYMSIKCYNFKGALLNRLNKTLSLARINNRELTLQFSVSSLNNRQENGVEKEDMMVMYSWCLKDNKTL